MRASIYNRNDGSSELVEITGLLINETEKAYLIAVDNADKHWLPKSQCHNFKVDSQDECDLEIPRWLAEERKLV